MQLILQVMLLLLQQEQAAEEMLMEQALVQLQEILVMEEPHQVLLA
jgi:hypothetical protein